MIVLHKFIIGLIAIPLIIQPITNTISAINAGRYIALPESMAWQCVDTIKRTHSKRIKAANKLDIDPAIKRQMIEFEQDNYKKNLKAACGIDDVPKQPPKDELMRIKP